MRARLIEFPPELEPLLRYGRGVDTTSHRHTGFEYRYTTAGAVESFIRAVRLRRSIGRVPPTYTYEHEVEEFFRRSPSAIRGPRDLNPLLLPGFPWVAPAPIRGRTFGFTASAPDAVVATEACE